VLAFGTTQPTTMTLAQAKRPRILVRRTQIVDLPPPIEVRPLYYRFGISYGPGLRLHRW
jgi:hypothetical protein